MFWDIHGNFGNPGNQHLNQAIPKWDLWDSGLGNSWESGLGNSWESGLWILWDSLLKVWCDGALKNFENRVETGKTYFDAQIRGMYEQQFMSRGGRWDLEGLKLEIAKMQGKNGAAAEMAD